MKDNIIMLDIYYGQMAYQQIKQRRMYYFSDFMSTYYSISETKLTLNGQRSSGSNNIFEKMLA